MVTLMLRALIVVGLWRVEEGDWYVNGRWHWRFWQSECIAGGVFYWPFVYDTDRLSRLQRATFPQADTMTR